MKRVLCLAVVILSVASIGMADHIGLYSDDSGESWCMLPGFYGGTGAVIIQKFSNGTYGSRWSVSLPAGSSYFSFQSIDTTTGAATSDISVGTGVCVSGDVVLGYLICNLTEGIADVLPAQGFSDILWLDCNFGENPGTGGFAYIGQDPASCLIGATEASTWGQVKALYR